MPWMLLLLAGLLATPAGAGTRSHTAARAETPATSSPSRAWDAMAHYRIALEARAHGQDAAAAAEFRAAIRLQPQWAEPRLSLAWLTLLSDPSEAGFEILQGAKLSLASFRTQYMVLHYGLLWGLLALLLGTLAAALCAIALACPELHHRVTEYLALFLDRRYAALVAILILVLPYCLGLGVLVPTLFLLGLLQSSLRGFSRAFWVLLLMLGVSTPWLVREADSLLLPRVGSTWIGQVLRAERTGWSPALDRELAQASSEAPLRFEIPFGRGLSLLRSGFPAQAVGEFERADSLQKGQSQVLNNLAVAYWLSNRAPEAENALQRSLEADASNASAHFNMAQVLSHRLAFDEANREMLRAGALDFDRLRRHFSANGVAPGGLLEQELSSASLWALWREEANDRASWTVAPGWLSNFWESRTPLFLVLAVGALVLGLILGRWMGRWLPVQRCANCSSRICRRCSGRRNAETYCGTCAGHLDVTEGGAFSRVLLERRRARRLREEAYVSMALRLAAPPFGGAIGNRWMVAWSGWIGAAFLALYTFWPAVLHAGPNVSVGLTSRPRMVGLALVWLAWWIPGAIREWRNFRLQRDLDEESVSPQFRRAA